MEPIFFVAPLVLTLLLREVGEFALRPGARRMRGQGQSSLYVWYVAYLTNLAFALWHCWSTPLIDQSWAGYAIVWVGMALRFAAMRELGVFYDVLIFLQTDHQLIDTGPYRWLRHPLHLGLHFEMLGLAVLADSAIPLGVFVASLSVCAWRNLEEERALEGHFGAAYRDYRTRAWDVVDILPGRHK